MQRVARNLFSLGDIDRNSALTWISLALGLTVALMLAAVPPAHAQVDITGSKLELRAVAPDRDTGKPVAVSLPSGVLGAKMSALLSIPLSTQLDTYWSKIPDPKTGVTPRQDACNGKGKIIEQVQQAVRKIGSSYNAYDISCNLASTGKLFADRINSGFVLTYLLEANNVHFTVTTPATCHAGHGTALCYDDPQFHVSFDTKIDIPIHTPGLCQLAAAEKGTIFTQNVKIDGGNSTGVLAQFVDNLLPGHRFSAAEQSIESATQKAPLPLDGDLKELRDSDACTGRNPLLHRALVPFRLDVLFQPEAVILQIAHAGIIAPTLDAPDPWSSSKPQPTFTHPMISANQPLVVAGNSLQISGQYFTVNFNVGSFANQLPLTLSHTAGYAPNSIILGGVCWGGYTELRWGMMGSAAFGASYTAQVSGDADGFCAKSYEANKLIPANTYDFRARDCDKFTCSPWSAPLRRMTAAAGGAHTDKRTVTLIIDRNADCKPPWCGPARNSGVVPQVNAASPGAGGSAASGECNTPLCRVGMSSSAARVASNPPPSSCDTPLCRSSHSSAASVAANARSGESNVPWNRNADKSMHTSQVPIPVGSAMLTPQGTFVANVTIPSSLASGSHMISASNGDVEADLAINVTAPNGGRGASLVIIAIVAAGESGCPNRPSGSVVGDTNFMLFGTGFMPGSVLVYADRATGTRPLGTANVHADGTFCEQMRGISGRALGPHTLLAVENGAVQAQAAITVVPPTQTHIN